MKVLVIGPSPTRSKGGMATVIKEMKNDSAFCRQFYLESYSSYVDGSKLWRAAYSVLAYWWFCLTKRHYDVYHLHVASRRSTFRKGLYARKIKKWGKKVILHIHGGEYMVFYQEADDSRKRKIIDILKSADMVIALSKEWKRKFDAVFGLENCVVLSNGIDIEGLRPAIARPEKFQNAFVCLGRLGKQKGIYDLIDAAALAVKEVPDLRVYLAGDGEIEQVKQRIKEKQLEETIEVVGWVAGNQKTALLGKASTVILPSYKEGLPMAILEGMACGKAVISTTVGAIPEVVHAENGILVEAGNIQGIADAMIKCCTDLAYMENASVQNIAKIEREYSMQKMHERLGGYYWRVYG